MKTFIELPQAGTRVQLYYKEKGADVPKSHLDGIWTGREWLMRKVYTTDEFEPLPEDFELVGYRPIEREPYSK